METRPCALHPNVFSHVLGNVVVRGVWLHRRKVHAAADYETDPRSSLVYWKVNGIMLRRLTRTSSITTYRIGADDRIAAPT
jgi:hypothetical protein